MQVSVENNGNVKRTVTITVPVDTVSAAYKKSFVNIAKKAKIDGFRKGHIPNNVLTQYFGGDIVEGAVKAIVDQTLFEALKQSGVEFVGYPSIRFDNEKAFNKDEDFVFFAEVEVLPVVEFKPFNELDLTVYNSQVNDSDVDAMIDNLRQQQATWKNVDGGEVTKDSLANINFLGRSEGVEFAGGKAENFELNIAQAQMIPGFTEQIIGHKSGDEFTINVKFPDDYHAEELKGKDAEFDIKINSVSEKVLPEVDADFIKLYGIGDGDIEKFRAELKKNMERECIRALTVNNRSQLYKAMFEAYKDSVEVPEAFVEERTEFLKNRTASEFKRMGITKLPEFKNDMFTEEAKRAAVIQTLVMSYMSQNNITEPADETVEKELDLIVGAYENPEDVKADIKKNKQRMQQIKDTALDHEIVAKIIEAASPKRNDITFLELINLRPEF